MFLLHTAEKFSCDDEEAMKTQLGDLYNKHILKDTGSLPSEDGQQQDEPGWYSEQLTFQLALRDKSKKTTERGG